MVFLFCYFSYYKLRKSVRGADRTTFFISNRGKEVTKIFSSINTDLKSRNIRYSNDGGEASGEIIQLSGSMIRKQIETAAAYHDKATRATCADALQHTEDVAMSHYRVGTSEVAIHQRESLLNIKQSELMTSSALEK